MIRFIISILLVCFSIGNLFAQKWKLTRYEASIGIGPANYFGDIGGAATRNNWFGIKDIQLLRTRPSFSLGARYKIRPDKAVKFNLNYCWLSATDEGSLNPTRGADRKGYKFNTQLIETSIQFEYSFFVEDKKRTSFAIFNKRGMLNNYSKFNLYGFLGVGSVMFFPSFIGKPNPSIEITNGYSKVAGIIPGGLGFKMIYSSKLALGIELGSRYTFSDYLDGFHTNFSKANDIYYLTTFNLVYRLKTSRSNRPIIFKY